MTDEVKSRNGNGKSLEKVGALWQNVSADGAPYFNLVVKDQKYVVFCNGYKSEEKQPDFLVYERVKSAKE